MYSIAYKISDPDAKWWGIHEHSDVLGVGPFNTSDDAIAAIRDIKDDPAANGGLCGWLSFAWMWVVDDEGNVIWN